MTSLRDKLGRCCQFTAFADVLAIKKCKTAMDQLFQNKSDNRNKRTVHLSERLIDEFAQVKVYVQLGFLTVKTLFFCWKSTFEFILHREKSVVNLALFPPMKQKLVLADLYIDLSLAKLQRLSGRFQTLIQRPGETVQNLESPGLSGRVDSPVQSYWKTVNISQ